MRILRYNRRGILLFIAFRRQIKLSVFGRSARRSVVDLSIWLTASAFIYTFIYNGIHNKTKPRPSQAGVMSMSQK